MTNLHTALPSSINHCVTIFLGELEYGPKLKSSKTLPFQEPYFTNLSDDSVL